MNVWMLNTIHLDCLITLSNINLLSFNCEAYSEILFFVTTKWNCVKGYADKTKNINVSKNCSCIKSVMFSVRNILTVCIRLGILLLMMQLVELWPETGVYFSLFQWCSKQSVQEMDVKFTRVHCLMFAPVTLS